MKRGKPAFIVRQGSAVVKAYLFNVKGRPRYWISFYRFAGDKRQVETKTGEQQARARAQEIAIAIANGRAQTLELTNADKDGYLYARSILPQGIPLHVAIEEWCTARSLLGPNVGIVEVAREWKRRHATEYCKFFDYPDVPHPKIYASKTGEGLPDTAAVYFIWAGLVCVYVGQSKNIRARCVLGDHPAIQPGEMISWISEPPERLKIAEAFYIGTLRPRRNFAGGIPRIIIAP